MLSLTVTSVEAYELQTCHHMRKRDQDFIKFKCRKHYVLSNHKTLQNKSFDLTQLKEVIYI